MKTTLRKHYTRIPLLLGFIFNILIIAGTFYFLTKNMYADFDYNKLLKFNLFSYTVIEGMNEKMAFALMVCFYAYTLSSIILSLLALIKKEPMLLSILCIINFFFGVYKVVIDYLTMCSFTGNTQMLFLFVLIADSAFLLVNALKPHLENIIVQRSYLYLIFLVSYQYLYLRFLFGIKQISLHRWIR